MHEAALRWTARGRWGSVAGMSSRATAAALWEPSPPEHWYLSDGFNMPITAATQRREDTVQQTFEARVARTGCDASILANVALRWDGAHPGVGVDPDVMWLEPSLPPGMRSVLTWEKGVGTVRVAVEIVGRDTARKDYQLGPAKYAASGTRELWVFDPEGYGRTETDEGPWTLQVWRRSKGGFRRVYAGDGPFRSAELGAWLVVVGDLLRVSEDREGTRLWPTTAEERDQERAERARAEQAQAHAEQERARAEQERDAAKAKAEAAEARIRALEALLAAREREG